jgi:hypothetical protein
MGQHGHGPKKHVPSTVRARHHSASAGTRHDLDSAWATGPARGTSTGTTRLGMQAARATLPARWADLRR